MSEANDSIVFDKYKFWFNQFFDGTPSVGLSGSTIVDWHYRMANDELAIYPVQKTWTVVIGGAWLGMDVCVFANASKIVYALEPIQSTFLKLYKNCKENKIYNVSLINAGFWNITGMKELDVIDTSLDATLNKGGQVIKKIGQENCMAYTWDDFVDLYNLQQVDLLKVDIEGAEGALIEKMTKCLPKHLIIAGYHATSPVNNWKDFLVLKGYVFDTIVGEYWGLRVNKKKGEHGWCYHLNV